MIQTVVSPLIGKDNEPSPFKYRIGVGSRKYGCMLIDNDDLDSDEILVQVCADRIDLVEGLVKLLYLPSQFKIVYAWEINENGGHEYDDEF
jgi:hypothetical protein